MSEVSPLATRQNVVRRCLLLDSANVADVLDEHGLPTQTLSADFRPVSGARLAGFAFTLTGSTEVEQPGKDALKMEACSKVSPHEVTVWSGGGGGGAFLGELMAVGLREQGSEGAIVEGAVRDRKWLTAMGFPVFATQVVPAQSAGRCRVVAYAEPVLLPGAGDQRVRVDPGDLLFGDEDGVVVVPGGLVEEVLVDVEHLTREEERIRSALQGGLTLRQCLEEHGKV